MQKLKLKSVYLFIFICLSFSASFSQKNYNLNLGGFYIPEENNHNIGFSSFSVSYPILQKEKTEFSAGIQFIGATTGVRGGFFAFGYTSEFNFKPFKTDKFYLGVNTSFLAGGGASAPDKDGWILQGSGFMQYTLFRDFKLYLGASYSYVSSGVISGWSPNLGFKLNLNYGPYDSAYKPINLNWYNINAEIGLAKSPKGKLGFVGASSSYQIGKLIAGDLSIHAIANTYGGYMQTLLSSGIALHFKKFQFNPILIAGLGGGGAAPVKGGALYGFGFSTKLLTSKVHMSLKYQYIKAIENVFTYHGVFASIGKPIASDSNSNFSWYPVMKTYFGENGFGNIGARFVAHEWRKVKFMGSTYWAFTDNKGAYAEGLFEIQVNAPNKIPLYILGSIGAGAGAGFNKKTESVLKGISLGVSSPFKKVPLSLEFSYWSGGNIPHYSISMTYKVGKTTKE